MSLPALLTLPPARGAAGGHAAPALSVAPPVAREVFGITREKVKVLGGRLSPAAFASFPQRMLLP